MPGSVVSESAERRRSRLIKVLLRRWFFHFNAWETPASPSELKTRRGHGRRSPICLRSRGRCLKLGWRLLFLSPLCPREFLFFFGFHLIQTDQTHA